MDLPSENKSQSFRTGCKWLSSKDFSAERFGNAKTPVPAASSRDLRDQAASQLGHSHIEPCGVFAPLIGVFTAEVQD